MIQCVIYRAKVFFLADTTRLTRFYRDLIYNKTSFAKFLNDRQHLVVVNVVDAKHRAIIDHQLVGIVSMHVALSFNIIA